VGKQVEERTAVQFERLAGQLTEHLSANWLAVPRRGVRSRFVPIKVPADLERNRPFLRDVLRAQGVL
jgi:UTP--glucose-1-phosphate uridylyltransferase